MILCLFMFVVLFSLIVEWNAKFGYKGKNIADEL